MAYSVTLQFHDFPVHACGGGEGAGVFAKHIFMHLSSFAFSYILPDSDGGCIESRLPLTAGGAGICHYNPTCVK